MSIRLPLTTVLSITDTATSGTVAYPFQAPQDTDNFVVKFYTGATFTGTNPTLDVYFQTSDDGGSTWYDVCNLGQIVAAVSAQNARWATVPVLGAMERTQGASVLAIGAAAASTAATSAYTGIPALSAFNRIFLKYGGTQVANTTGVQVRVYANQQSATA